MILVGLGGQGSADPFDQKLLNHNNSVAPHAVHLDSAAHRDLGGWFGPNTTDPDMAGFAGLGGAGAGWEQSDGPKPGIEAHLVHRTIGPHRKVGGMQIGFIGAGSMAQAIIKGIVGAGFSRADQIGASDLDTTKLTALANQTGITVYSSNLELVAASDLVVLAVKPINIAAVLIEARPAIEAKSPLVVSIAAGIGLPSLSNLLGPNVPLVRAMPNLNVKVGEGMTAIAGHQTASQEQVRQVVSLFDAVGQTLVVEERLFPALGAIAGCSPAWIFLLIDALARGALTAGLPKAVGLEAATQAVLGSAKLLASTDQHPGALIDQVASPGGTTVAGLNALDERGFAAAVVAAVSAAISRDRELGSQ